VAERKIYIYIYIYIYIDIYRSTIQGTRCLVSMAKCLVQQQCQDLTVARDINVGETVLGCMVSRRDTKISITRDNVALYVHCLSY
jgi:hypothetical protein